MNKHVSIADRLTRIPVIARFNSQNKRLVIRNANTNKVLVSAVLDERYVLSDDGKRLTMLDDRTIEVDTNVAGWFDWHGFNGASHWYFEPLYNEGAFA